MLMATSKIQKPLSVKSGQFICNLTANSDNALVRNRKATTLITSGTIPSDLVNCNYMVDYLNVSNAAMINFHCDQGGLHLYAYTNVTQEVRVRWMEFLF